MGRTKSFLYCSGVVVDNINLWGAWRWGGPQCLTMVHLSFNSLSSTTLTPFPWCHKISLNTPLNRSSLSSGFENVCSSKLCVEHNEFVVVRAIILFFSLCALVEFHIALNAFNYSISIWWIWIIYFNQYLPKMNFWFQWILCMKWKYHP